MMGPLEYLVVGFDGYTLSPEIVRELDEVRQKGTVRMLDLIFVAKDGDGAVTIREVSDLSDADAASLGMVDEPGDQRVHYSWFSEGDLEVVGGQLPVSSSAIVMLFEHAWAAELRSAIIGAGGVLVAQERIPPEMAAEVEAALSKPG